MKTSLVSNNIKDVKKKLLTPHPDDNQPAQAHCLTTNGMVAWVFESLAPIHKVINTLAKNINKVLALILLVINLGYFIPLTVVTINSGGGSWGYSFLGLPVTLIVNLLLIPAIISLALKEDKPIGLLIVNSLGFLWAVFWFFIFITVPQID